MKTVDNRLIEHIKRSGRYAGTFVAKVVGDNVVIGWSKCHWLDYDKYTEMYNSEKQLKNRGIQIAEDRITKTRSAPIADSFKEHLENFVVRIRKQKRFKDKTIVLANLWEPIDDGITEVGGAVI